MKWIIFQINIKTVAINRLFYVLLCDFFKDILRILLISISRDISIHDTRIYLQKFTKRNGTERGKVRDARERWRG